MRASRLARRGAGRRTGPDTGTGYSIPVGSLDNYRAARAVSSSTLAEFVIAGDSTWAGQTLADGNYSPATRLRQLFNAAGFTDGGHGHNNGVYDTPSVSGETASGVVLNTYATAGSSQAALPGESVYSNAVGDRWTYTVTGSHLRLYYNAFNTLSGPFTYKIDGGSAVTVTPPDAGSIDPNFKMIDLPGLADTQHTVEINNPGGAVVAPPNVISSGAFSSGGTIPAGTYYYGVTIALSGGGETTPVIRGPVTIAAGQKFYVQATAIGTGRTLRLYRGTSSDPATMGLVATGAGSGSTMQLDDSGANAPGAAPPGTNTAVDTARTIVNTNVDAVKDTGIVLHNQAVRSSIGDYTHANGNGAKRLALQLGLTVPSQNALASAGSISTDPGVRRPKLAIFALGINNPDAAVLFNDCVEFIRATRVAGADPLVCVQHFDYDQGANKALAQAKMAAVHDAAVQEGSAWADLGAGGALGPFSGWAVAGYGGGSNNPHLTKLAYQTQAEFLWSNVLSK